MVYSDRENIDLSDFDVIFCFHNWLVFQKNSFYGTFVMLV
jgi:hypothetical protein